jgi:hypothetical protein
MSSVDTNLGRVLVEQIHQKRTPLAQRDRLALASELVTDFRNGRRGFLRAVAVGSTALLMPFLKPAYASSQIQSGTVINVTASPFNADPTGASDSSNAFQSALTALTGIHGTLYVPNGNYSVGSPLSFTGGSISIVGDGEAESVIVVKHSSTALTINCNNNYDCVTVRDIGLAPCPGSNACAGIAFDFYFPNANSAWQHCLVENVDLGVARPGYTCFLGGLRLTNSWIGHVQNVRMRCNISTPTGSFFAQLNGYSIDNHFADVRADGMDIGISVNGYTEGLRVKSSEMITNTGIWTGSSSYSGTVGSSPLVNINQLMVSDCELNCNVQAINAYQIWGSFITSTHMGSKTAGIPTCTLLGSCNTMFSNCLFTGQLNSTGAQSPFTGLLLEGSNPSWHSASNQLMGCTFANQQYGIVLGAGTVNTTGTGTSFLAPGDGSMVTSPTQIGSLQFAPVVDNSGNATNAIGWMGAAGMVVIR